jgi:hypothetical protein
MTKKRKNSTKHQKTKRNQVQHCEVCDTKCDVYDKKCKVYDKNCEVYATKCEVCDKKFTCCPEYSGSLHGDE